MKAYLEITIPAGESERELLIARMVDLGCQGFLETDSSLVSYVEVTRLTSEQRSSLPGRLTSILNVLSIPGRPTMREIPEENWNRRWEESIEPIEIGERLVIKPSWRTYPQGTDKLILEIDPKMSFGTGHHETTRLCVRLLERWLKPGSRVLDVGTGTGILAIAAVKLGAASAVGIDNDEWSVRNALENVKANGVAGSVRISESSFEDFGAGQFDCVLANLSLAVISGALDDLIALTAAEGCLILSGFLCSDAWAIERRLTAFGLVLADRLDENDWMGVVVRRK
jgi:ribosomal protein L11 methyltransferase